MIDIGGILIKHFQVEINDNEGCYWKFKFNEVTFELIMQNGMFDIKGEISIHWLRQKISHADIRDNQDCINDTVNRMEYILMLKKRRFENNKEIQK